MSGTTTVRHAVRLALVSVGIAGAVALSGSAAFADGTTTPQVSAVPTPTTTGVKPSVEPTARAEAKPSVSPTSPAEAPGPQVKVVPKGGAQTGEGDAGSSTGTVIAGSGLAAAGVAGIGFAVVRRRAGARG